MEENNITLSNKWSLWYHHEKDNWKISGYKKIYEINNSIEFWKLYQNWYKIKGINYKHYFFQPL